MRRALPWLAGALALSALAAELPVRQVVLYKHGVGYFERSGELAPGDSARLDFKASEMDDVLKSLTIEDFIRLLQAHGIGRLVDIRAFPASRRSFHLPPHHLTRAAIFRWVTVRLGKFVKMRRRTGIACSERPLSKRKNA